VAGVPSLSTMLSQFEVALQLGMGLQPTHLASSAAIVKRLLATLPGLEFQGLCRAVQPGSMCTVACCGFWGKRQMCPLLWHISVLGGFCAVRGTHRAQLPGGNCLTQCTGVPKGSR
jgi:hypothetical protein